MSYPLRMRHLSHGWHHAYNAFEEERLRASGWIDDAPINAPAQDEPPTAVALVSSVEPDVGAPIPKRRGRPPKVT